MSLCNAFEVIQGIHTIQVQLRQIHDGLLESYLERCVGVAWRGEDCGVTVLDGMRDAFSCLNKSGR